MRKHIKDKKKLARLVGYSSLALMIGLGVAFIFPTVSNKTNAITADSSNPITDGAKLKAETYVYSTLAISLSESVNLDVVPKAGGSFTTGGAELNITTNNTTGYAVYLQTGDNTSTLKPANGMVDARIKPVVGEMNESNFQQNLDTWGYAIGQADASLSSMNYKALPSASDPAVITTDSLTASDSYTLGFAASISPNLPAGKYYNSVLVSVVANPIAVHTLSGITYMQEMSPYVCDYSDEHETKQLIDTRDGKSYWVAKLKDGNCWMVQNLALDLDVNEQGNAVAVSESGSEVELNSNNTDITGVWKGAKKTEREIPAKSTPNYANIASWDLGDIVLTNPTDSSLCSTPLPEDLKAQGYTDDALNSVWYNHSSLTENCSQWYKNVNDLVVGYNATETSSISPDETSYDSHYLVGNYYTWTVATAGTGTVLSSPSSADVNPNDLVDANSSICPRGWQLPASGRYYLDNISYPFERKDSFMNLFMSYGYPTGAANAGWSSNNGNPFISFTGKTRPDYDPFYFVRSGRLSFTAGAVVYPGSIGSYWSNTAGTSSVNNAFFFDFGIEYFNVNPSHITSRYSGFSVRCLAR